MKVNRYTQIKLTDKRVRASIQYARWVERNRLTSCVRCNSTTDLEVHHLIELYHVISGMWKFYGDWESVFHHAVAMHDDNRCEGVTLCDKCHLLMHPGRTTAIMQATIRNEDWCVLPRNLEVNFALGVKSLEPGKIGLIGFQTLFGFGWNIMNGYGGRILDFNWRRFADLMGKTPGQSFLNGFLTALNSLVGIGIVEAWTKDGNSVEIHLSQKYLRDIETNPWFFSLDEAKTSRMSTLVLRWILSFQANKSVYTISRDKLVTHMQLGTTSPTFVLKCLKDACDDIPWASFEEDGNNIKFRFKNRGMIPIHSLRQILQDNISKF